jgi:quinol monooxygenase YgiN
MSIGVFAKLTAQPGKRDEVIEVLGTHFPNVEEEAGTVIYAMHADNQDADVIWFYELYTDDDALKAHGGSPGMKELGGKLAGLVAGRTELHFATPVKAKGLTLPS